MGWRRVLAVQINLEVERIKRVALCACAGFALTCQRIVQGLDAAIESVPADCETKWLAHRSIIIVEGTYMLLLVRRENVCDGVLDPLLLARREVRKLIHARQRHGGGN